MTAKREQCFECILWANGMERATHLGAWTPEAAEDEFRDLLASQGILQPGTILVRDVRGRVLIEAEYEPTEVSTHCEVGSVG